jgi:predicted PurR-regulated permease PerM
MINKLKIKAIAGILVVFLIGVIIGALGTGIFIRRQIRQFTAEKGSLQTFFMRRLDRELKLTEAQKPEVAKILEQVGVDLRQFLQNSQTEFRTIMDKRNAQLKEILTPEQQHKLDVMAARIHKRWETHTLPENHHERF